MSLNNIEEISFCIHQDAPKIHCLTNPVTMQDVANLLLAAGGSAVMGQDEQEVEEITSFCHGTLLNTGVPDIAKIQACILAGQKANALGHPVVLDPVGAGASTFRRKELQKLLQAVHPTAVRCNQEEAVVLCSLLSDTDSPEKHGGVESSLQMAERDVCLIAGQAASLLNCTVLITGKEDVVSDGKQTQIRIFLILDKGLTYTAFALNDVYEIVYNTILKSHNNIQVTQSDVSINHNNLFI